MDQDDPEKRITELERQLAEPKRGYPDGNPGSALDQWMLVGFAFWFVVLGITSFVAAFGLTVIVDPSSAEWTGRIICANGYHLEGREEATMSTPDLQYNAPSTTAYTAAFTCVNGNQRYAISDGGGIVVLQALAIMLVVGLPQLGVAAVVVLTGASGGSPGDWPVSLALFLLVRPVDHRARDGVLEQVETQKRRAGVLAEIKLVDVHSVHGDVVAVRAVAGGRRGADVAAHAGVVDQLQGATW
jgi:hypothetical protein